MFFVLSRKDEKAEPGQIAPTTSAEMKTHGAAYRLYSLLFPVMRLVSRMDSLLPGNDHYAVIVTAEKIKFCSMKVLITGGGGFIGSHLVDSQLAHGNKSTNS